MKRTTLLTTLMVCLFGMFCLTNQSSYAQGNNNGNANPNNNANGNALKWETQGNNADTSHFIGTTNPIPLKMRTNNTERMRITEDGKVGIGISNPLERFELQGNLKLTGDVVFSGYADPTDTLGKLLFVDENGKTYPKTLESLFDAIYTPIYGDCNIDNDGNVISPVWHNGLNKIYNECPINVGIRTDNPLFSLDVRGQLRSTQNIFLGTPALFTFNDLARIHVVNTISLAANNKGDFLRFDEYVNGYNNDNLKTVFKVDQNGFVTARDVKVTLQDIPDFVFLPEYKLPTLEEQASFINKNGHLMRMPSEKQILDENIGLGKIAMANLQISEEQMLYIIELDKEVESLSNENEALKERLRQLEEMVKKLLEEQ
ncbi:MAG: bZIP transcription factor [Brumimicrobium sp.]|nr:bZIP transcription factor [Brumimicrobium sp.]